MEKIKHELRLDGTIQDGYSLDAAFKELRRLFKDNADRFSPLLHGQPVTQSLYLTPDHAERLRAFFAGIGVQGQIVPEAPPETGAAVDLVAMAGMNQTTATAPPDDARQATVASAATGDNATKKRPGQAGGSTLQLVPIEAEATEAQPAASVSRYGMVCPKCGMDQAPSEQCIACGIYFAKFRAQQDDTTTATPTETPASERTTGEDAPTLAEGMLEFVRDNGYYYEDRFAVFRAAGDGFRPTWHWPGFFFPFHWALYRKLWLWAVVLFVAPLLLVRFMPLLGLILVNTAFALSANFIYYRHVKNAVSRLRTRRKATPASLASAGGTSWPAVVAGFLLPAVLGGALMSWIMPESLQGIQDMQSAYEAQDPRVMKSRQGQETFLNMTMAKLAIAVTIRQGELRADEVSYDSLVAKGIPANNLIDGWGTPYRISASGTEITIVSAGPDREFDTADDLRQ